MSVINYREDGRPDDILVKWVHLSINRCGLVQLCDEVMITWTPDTKYLPACSDAGQAPFPPPSQRLSPGIQLGRTEGSNQLPVLLHPALAVPANGAERKTAYLFSRGVSHPSAGASHGSLPSESCKQFPFPLLQLCAPMLQSNLIIIIK